MGFASPRKVSKYFKCGVPVPFHFLSFKNCSASLHSLYFVSVERSICCFPLVIILIFMTVNNQSTLPFVSIGLPVYNAENHLRDAMESLLSQEYNNFELIISDNASTDRTAEICKGYAAKDNRIKFFQNPKNDSEIA